jgi:hypothetical protein
MILRILLAMVIGGILIWLATKRAERYYNNKIDDIFNGDIHE